MLNDSLRYRNDQLYCDGLPVADIVARTGTPVYLYSLPRALANLQRIRAAFSWADAHIHYSVKANASLTLLRALIQAGAGIDAVSKGEMQRALLAGASPGDVVFAGVGKTHDELAWALRQKVGWINVENVGELELLNQLAGSASTRIALRLNPQVKASTHHHIATGHGGAKFGLTAAVIRDILAHQASFPALDINGLHLHIGSQLGDLQATQAAIRLALELMAPYPALQTLNIGGGLPVAYGPQDEVPEVNGFAQALRPLLEGRPLLLEPGRAIVADAGILVTSVLYCKHQAGHRFIITDASMSELIRPALYQALHAIVPLQADSAVPLTPAQVVGPVCESADQLGHDVPLPPLQPGDRLAILDTGAYGMVMASNYNQRPRPPEVVVMADGQRWQVTRERETLEDLLRGERMF